MSEAVGEAFGQLLAEERKDTMKKTRDELRELKIEIVKLGSELAELRAALAEARARGRLRSARSRESGCGAAQIQRIAENAPRRPDMNT